MHKLSSQSELQKLVDNHEIVEVRFLNLPGEFKVSFILNVNDEYITFAEIDPDGELDGVCMYRKADISSIKARTHYLDGVKKTLNNTIYERARQDINGLKNFTFFDFILYLEMNSIWVEFLYKEGFQAAGKIVSHDEEVVVLDEFDENDAKTIAQSFVNVSAITRISIDVPWVKEIALSLSK